MTNAELLAKIKAEIKRRITNKTFGGKLELIDILAWLDTLESEKPMNQEGLEKEYKDYVESDPVYSKLVNRNAGLSIARHFAEWGAEHAREQMMKWAVPFYEILKAVPPGPERDNVRIIIVKED